MELVGYSRPLERLGRSGWVYGLAVAVLLLWSWSPALDPAVRLVPRDAVTFNLPLLASYSQLLLAEGSIPQWNPHLAGGQPVVSNPNYGALYPPTWLISGLETGRAFQLLVALHLLWAALGGAWAFRALGLSGSAQALAALACGGGAWIVGLLFAARILFGLAWLPWVWGAALRLHAPTTGWRRSWQLLRFGLALAGIGYAGEPVSLLLGGAVALLGILWRGRLSPSLVLRALVALGISGLLAAPALLPAVARLGSSIRFEGLTQEQALLWSLRPVRLLELPFPRLAGDPGRFEEGYFLGWNLHDRKFAYVLFLTPGTLLLLLGVARLLRKQEAARIWPLRLASLAGIFLALGRYNPLLAPIWPQIPILKSIRYPEKFILLTTFCLLLAGIVEWDRLLRARQAGRPEAVDLPALLATGLAVLTLGIWLGLLSVPAWSEELISQWTPLGPTNPDHLRAARSLEANFGRTALHATGLALLLWAFRLRSVPSSRFPLLAIALVGAEQLDLGGSLYRPISRSDFERPSPIVESCQLRPGDRIWTEVEWMPEAGFYLPVFRRPAEMAQTQLERLDPTAGALFGLRYVLHQDYDLTHTPPVRRAVALLGRLAGPRGIGNDDSELSRYLQAWGVRCAIRVRLPREILPELQEDPNRRPALAYGYRLPHPLPEARFVAEARWYPDAASAEAGLVREGFQVAFREHLIGAGPRVPVRFDTGAQVLSYRPTGFGALLDYRAFLPALLVVAQTYDPHLRATRDRQELQTFETASGMVGVLVPPGEGRIELRYRDPWIGLGLWLAGLGVLVGLSARWLPARKRLDP